MAVAAPDQRVAPAPHRRRRFNEYTWTAILFLLPTVLALLIFVIWPIIDSFRLSLYKWNGVDPVQTFLGLENWTRLVQDGIFWRAVRNNFVIVILSIAIQLPIGMALAVLLDTGGRKMRIFKVAYFLPLLMSTVAIGILFKYLYDPYFGLVNAALNAVGLKFLAQEWLSDGGWQRARAQGAAWTGVPIVDAFWLPRCGCFRRKLQQMRCQEAAPRHRQQMAVSVSTRRRQEADFRRDGPARTTISDAPQC